MDYRESFHRSFRIEFPIECLLFHTPAWNHIPRVPVANTMLPRNYNWHSSSHFDPSTSALKIIFMSSWVWATDKIKWKVLLSLCKPFSLSNFNLFFVCSLTRRLQDCFNKTLIHWRPWWMTWIGRYLIRCGWHDLNIGFIFYLNIRKQNKCFASRLRWSAMKPALPFRSLTLVKKTIVLIWRQKYNVNLMQTGFVDKLISKLLQQVKALESNS